MHVSNDMSKAVELEVYEFVWSNIWILFVGAYRNSFHSLVVLLWQISTSASPLPVLWVPPVWMRLTDIAACVSRTEPDPTVKKVWLHLKKKKSWVFLLYMKFLSLTFCLFNTVTKKHCSVNGHVAADGTKWEEDCNSCQCSNGKVVCTKVGINKMSTHIYENSNIYLDLRAKRTWLFKAKLLRETFRLSRPPVKRCLRF